MLALAVNFASNAVACGRDELFYVGVDKEIEILLGLLSGRVEIEQKLIFLFGRKECEGLFKSGFRQGLSGFGFEPLVEPAEEYTLPHDRVLRLENPVVFVGEDKHLGRHTAEAGSIECHHTLRGEDAEIIFAVGDEDGVSHLSTKRWGDAAKVRWAVALSLAQKAP